MIRCGNISLWQYLYICQALLTEIRQMWCIGKFVSCVEYVNSALFCDTAVNTPL